MDILATLAPLTSKTSQTDLSEPSTKMGEDHIFTVLTGAEKSLVPGVFQTFSIKESEVGGTSDVLGSGSKSGKMTLSLLSITTECPANGRAFCFLKIVKCGTMASQAKPYWRRFRKALFDFTVEGLTKKPPRSPGAASL